MLTGLDRSGDMAERKRLLGVDVTVCGSGLLGADGVDGDRRGRRLGLAGDITTRLSGSARGRRLHLVGQRLVLRVSPAGGLGCAHVRDRGHRLVQRVRSAVDHGRRLRLRVGLQLVLRATQVDDLDQVATADRGRRRRAAQVLTARTGRTLGCHGCLSES